MTASGFFGGFVWGAFVTLVTGAYYYYSSIDEKSSDDDGKGGLRGSRALLSSAKVSRGISSGGGFLTDLMAQLWPYMEVAVSESIRETVEPTFADLPGPLAKLHFTKCRLGKVPIRLDNVIVHNVNKDNGSVQVDVDFVWDGDCDICFKAPYLGSFGVRKLKLMGRMALLKKPLTYQLPVVDAVQYAFISPPHLDLDFYGLAQVADFKVVSKKIHDTMLDSINSLMVLPNRMLYKMNPLASFMDVYQPPLGVARITAVSGKGFKIEKRTLGKDDIPDVYCNISLGGSNVWRTASVKNSLTPVWKNQVADFLLWDNSQILTVHAWDEDKGTLDADDDLGSSQVTLGEVLLAGGTLKLDLAAANGKQTGASVTVRCDVCKLASDRLESITQPIQEQQEAKNHLLRGLVTIVITGAFDIPLEKSEASTFVKVNYGESEFVTSAVVDAEGVDALNPVYDCAFHVPLTSELEKKDGDNTVVLTLMNGEDTVLGSTKVTRTALADAPNGTITEKRKMGDAGASLEFRVSLAGVLNAGEKPLFRSSVVQPVESSVRSTDDVPPLSPLSQPEVEDNSIGSVRITAVKGWGFQIEKKRFKKDDIPDVYCMIKFGSSPKVWRTATIKNSTTPEWNESSDYTLMDHGQVISVDTYEEDKGARDKDDYLGSVKLTVGKLLLAGGTMDLELEQDGKGTGHYVALRCDMVDA